MYPKTWSIWNIWTVNALNLSTLQALQHFSLACKIQFLKTCPNKISHFSARASSTCCKETCQKKKKSRAKVQRQNSRTVSIKKNNLEATKESTFVAKSIIAHLNHLPLSFSFCLQQQQQPNHCHKIKITRNQTLANSHVTQRYGKKRNYPTAQGKCFLSNKQIFRVSLHQANKFQHFDSGWNRDWCAVEGLCTVFEA